VVWKKGFYRWLRRRITSGFKGRFLEMVEDEGYQCFGRKVFRDD